MSTNPNSVKVRRTDSNQKQIVEDLRALGYSVGHTHTIGKGFPDIIIGKHGYNLMVEIKQPGEHLTEDERDFFATWKGMVLIGYSAEQIHDNFMARLG